MLRNPEARSPARTFAAEHDRDGTGIASFRFAMGRLALASIAFAALTACGKSSAPLPEPETAARHLALRAAIDAPTLTQASSVVVSCHGEVICREDTALSTSPNDDPLADAREDCTRHGGETKTSTCPRSGVVARCSLASERGTIQVFLYSPGAALGTMSEQCEDFGGSFELAAR
jgi:hypothetical protein